MADGRVLTGVSFVLVGKIDQHKLSEEIVEQGGTVTSSVSRKTSFVVATEVEAARSKLPKKLEQALEKKVPIVRLSWLRRIITSTGFEGPKPNDTLIVQKPQEHCGSQNEAATAICPRPQSASPQLDRSVLASSAVKSMLQRGDRFEAQFDDKRNATNTYRLPNDIPAVSSSAAHAAICRKRALSSIRSKSPVFKRAKRAPPASIEGNTSADTLNIPIDALPACPIARRKLAEQKGKPGMDLPNRRLSLGGWNDDLRLGASPSPAPGAPPPIPSALAAAKVEGEAPLTPVIEQRRQSFGIVDSTSIPANDKRRQSFGNVQVNTFHGSASGDSRRHSFGTVEGTAPPLHDRRHSFGSVEMRSNKIPAEGIRANPERRKSIGIVETRSNKETAEAKKPVSRRLSMSDLDIKREMGNDPREEVPLPLSMKSGFVGAVRGTAGRTSANLRPNLTATPPLAKAEGPGSSKPTQNFSNVASRVDSGLSKLREKPACGPVPPKPAVPRVSCGPQSANPRRSVKEIHPVKQRTPVPNDRRETNKRGTPNPSRQPRGKGAEPEWDNEVYQRLKKSPHCLSIEDQILRKVVQEIIETDPDVQWDQISGLTTAKDQLYESVILPSKNPALFSGLRAPARGLLLFGPTGNGKTMLAKAVASQCHATFISLSASSLTSKWHGEAEKIVRAVFAVARALQPSVVFIDEVDSLLQNRSNSEHEASRRLKTEYLVQADGICNKTDDRILVLAATNRPQDLDDAVLRRFTKRIYIPLPDNTTRRQMIQRVLERQSVCWTEEDWDYIVNQTEGYSGSDIANMCREMALMPIRELGRTQAETISVSDLRGISVADAKSALEIIRPSVSKDSLETLVRWNLQYGMRTG